MKLMTNFLILAFAGTALAQAPAAKPATPSTKPGATTPANTTPVNAKPANAKPAQATPAKPAQATPAKPMQANTTSKVTPTPAAKPQTTAAKPQAVATKPATTAVKPAMPPAKGATAAAKPAVKKEAPAKKAEAKKEAAPAKPEVAAEAKDQKPAETEANGKNHRDPFVSVVVSRDGAPCAGGGKKCIDIAQVTLQGVVRAPSGPIAVISSGSSKTFFLRENDPVYNGVVVKISPDSIVFRETVMDRVGKTSQREVVKKIHNAPAV